jgi:hypothetical protein
MLNISFLPQYCLSWTVQISYTVEKFEMLNAHHNFLFLFEFFNYAAIARRFSENFDPASHIDSLNARVKNQQMSTFYTSKTGNKNKKRVRDGDGGGDAQPPPGPSQSGSKPLHASVFDNPVIRSQLSAAGYSVAEAWTALGMEPFDRVS